MLFQATFQPLKHLCDSFCYILPYLKVFSKSMLKLSILNFSIFYISIILAKPEFLKSKVIKPNTKSVFAGRKLLVLKSY